MEVREGNDAGGGRVDQVARSLMCPLVGQRPCANPCTSCSFDSIQDGTVAAFTPHTAFDDPSMPPDAPPRESIELRALVFYD